MSPLDDYHTNESQNSTNQTSSAIRKEDAKNKNTIYVVIISFLIIVIASGAVYFGTRSNTTSGDSKAAETSSSSLSSVASTSVSSSSSSIAPREISNVSNAEGALTKEQITDARKQATDLAGKTSEIDAEKIINNTLTSTTVGELKTKLGPEAPSLKVPAGKSVELTIKYSSIGDSDFQNGSLYIKLSDGLSLVPGSIKDTFLTRAVAVNDSVYNSSTKLIVYGPGSGNKATSPMKVGETGSLTFKVQIDSGSSNSLAVASYLREESGKIGQPAIFFVDVTN